jgi:hypothetical protein
MCILFFLLALSRGLHTRAETEVPTSWQLAGGKTDAHATALLPLNMQRSTTVYSAMFQLGSGAGGDSEVIRSLVSPDPRPDTEPSVLTATNANYREFLTSVWNYSRVLKQFGPLRPQATDGRAAKHAARHLRGTNRASSADGSGRATIAERLTVLFSTLTYQVLPKALAHMYLFFNQATVTLNSPLYL